MVNSRINSLIRREKLPVNRTVVANRMIRLIDEQTAQYIIETIKPTPKNRYIFAVIRNEKKLLRKKRKILKRFKRLAKIKDLTTLHEINYFTPVEIYKAILPPYNLDEFDTKLEKIAKKHNIPINRYRLLGMLTNPNKYSIFDIPKLVTLLKEESNTITIPVTLDVNHYNKLKATIQKPNAYIQKLIVDTINCL